MTDVYLKARLAAALGGRVAEEIVFDDITTGASSDLQSVTQIARAMVTQFGMSEKLGPVTYGEKEELIFLGRELSEQRNYSDETAEEIDEEVKRIVSDAYKTAKNLLLQYRHILDTVAKRLLEQETLDADEFAAIFTDGTPEALLPAD
jgi:cell division protease FtsH